LNKIVKIVLVGTGGYGQYYLRTLLDEFPEGQVLVQGVVDPFCQKTPLYDEIKHRGIHDYPTIRKFYNVNPECDLAIISSPIHFHVPHTMYALSQGSHVLCDKPLAASVQDVDHIISARDELDKKVWVGFQWSFSNAIQELKRDIISGIYGKPLKMKSLCFWPRSFDYYNRNDWAGRIQSRGGRWILDSPANNAMAHFIHNMFYLAGKDIHVSASPVKVDAMVFSSYPVENYDTIACRINTNEDVEMFFYGSHTTEKEFGPVFEIFFEDAVVHFGGPGKGIVAENSRGIIREYGSPDDDHQFLKLFYAVNGVHHDENIICGPEAARAQVQCINMIQDSISNIKQFPDSKVIDIPDENRIFIKDLDKILYDCYNQAKLPDIK